MPCLLLIVLIAASVLALSSVSGRSSEPLQRETFALLEMMDVSGGAQLAPIYCTPPAVDATPWLRSNCWIDAPAALGEAGILRLVRRSLLDPGGTSQLDLDVTQASYLALSPAVAQRFPNEARAAFDPCVGGGDPRIDKHRAFVCMQGDARPVAAQLGRLRAAVRRRAVLDAEKLSPRERAPLILAPEVFERWRRKDAIERLKSGESSRTLAK